MTEATLRDQVAVAALQGWLSGPCQGDALDCYEGNEAAFTEHQQAVAKACYGYADAFLAERERKEPAGEEAAEAG